MSITALVSAPMANLLVGFPQAASLLACFSRIQEFLLLKPLHDANGPATVGPVQTPVEAQKSTQVVDSMFGIELVASDSPSLKKDIGTTRPFIELANASIALTVDDEPVLQGVNLQVLPSTITVVVGPVASGKSTLLRALLGETHIKGAAVILNQMSTGYCDQVPWLRNVSIQDNIIGPAKLDTFWYDTVLSCCLLHDDLRDISDGDQALAGSGGATLSGGQKQRVVCSSSFLPTSR